MSSFTDRMIRAAKLDPELYEEVEADTSSMGQAMTVVVLSSIAAGIGSLGTYGLRGLVSGVIWGLGGWFVWAYITYYIGTRLLPEPQTRADHGELLRTIGFSSSPGIIRVFGIIPILGWFLNVTTSVWMLAAMVIAIRQALDYTSTLRAAGVCIVGWLVQAVLMAIVMWIIL